MTVAIREEDLSLVAPVELLPMPPAFMSASAFLDDVLPESPTEPGFLIRARLLSEEHPKSATAQVRLAQAELAAGETALAIEAAERAAVLLRDVDDESAVIGAAQVFIWADAVDRAADVISRRPLTPLTKILAARIAIAAERLDVADALLADLESRDALMTRGWVLVRLGRFEESVRVLRLALRQRLSSAALTNLGYAYAALGARRKAVRVTKQARTLDPASQLVRFNLISFFVADGDFDEAIAEAHALQEYRPADLRPILAEAAVWATSGSLDKAHRLLRRARTSALWAAGSLIERSELEANLAFIEWQLRIKTLVEARSIVVQALERAEFKASGLSWMLPALMNTTTERDQLERLTQHLAEANPRERFHRLHVQLALLRCDFDQATQLAVNWAHSELFDSSAAGTAVYLLVEAKAAYQEAIDLGTKFLKRAPVARQLINNVAYALALSGRLEEARALLGRIDATDNVYLIATRALVDILSGEWERGLREYDQAYELAQQSEDERLAQRVRLNRALAVWRARDLNKEEASVALELPEEWRKDPHIVLLKRIAEREGVPIRDDVEGRIGPR
jgi:Flp pilus assembly protein TadD